MSEAAEQIKVIKWSELARGKYPELDMLYHVPNGGSRNKLEAIHLKQEGVKAGVPDLMLPVAHGKYIGACIEMKYGQNKPTPVQVKWLQALKQQGHYVAVCYSAEEAIKELTTYMNMEEKNK